jgi:hypothetical protein
MRQAAANWVVKIGQWLGAANDLAPPKWLRAAKRFGAANSHRFDQFHSE